jgi:voltage-gated potassium channel
VKYLAGQLAYFWGTPEGRRNTRGLLRYVVFLSLLVLLFTFLFQLIMRVEAQHHSWVAGLYWTVVTMTTLGFGDIIFQSDLGRLFSLLVLLSGVVFLLVLLPFLFIRLFYAPWLEARLHLRAPRRVPPGTQDHVLVCAYDEIAPDLVARLRLAGVPYYVLEPDPQAAAALQAQGVSMLAGDIDNRVTYEAAHADRARLVFANAADTVNTNITLTVREVAPHVSVAALASDEDSVDILELAGATHVLPLRQRLGEQLANRAEAGNARSHVIGRFRDLRLAEFAVQNTPLVGRTIRESRLREVLGISIVGIWDGGRLRPPSAQTRLTERCVPVAVGTEEQIRHLDELLAIYNPNDNPVIIIGGGKVGRSAARALRRQDVPVHLIERKPELAHKIRGVADRLIAGDASDITVLEQAGIRDTPSVLLTTHDDAMNIYLAVYCRRLRPDVRILSRITHERNIEAVHRAGADFVLGYAALGVATVLSLIHGRELILLWEGVDLFTVPVPDSLRGRTLADSGIGARTGLNVIAIQRDGHVLTNPRGDAVLNEGSQLVMIGSAEQRAQFVATFAA